MAKNTKVGVPNRKEEYPVKILFSKSVRRMFAEITLRHQKELNDALIEVYEETKILDRVQDQQATGERFELLRDFSGVTIHNPEAKQEELKKEALEKDRKKALEEKKVEDGKKKKDS